MNCLALRLRATRRLKQACLDCCITSCLCTPSGTQAKLMQNPDAKPIIRSCSHASHTRGREVYKDRARESESERERERDRVRESESESESESEGESKVRVKVRW